MCGVDQYDPSQYVCLDSGFLCPIIDGNITLKCDDTCYAPAQYGCTLDQIYPLGTPLRPAFQSMVTMKSATMKAAWFCPVARA
ncbi:carbohydrate binding-domain-containing protein [Mycena galopus ATCC 62051]|nr:carbohydrate binding-domain-containing protein [Mycena galopus ATCC 62051]